MVTVLLGLLLVGVIGVLVGAVGVGGFLLVPVLVLVQGAAIRNAVVVATLSFLVAGVVSLLAMRKERIDGRDGVGAFLLWAGPGAAAGALLVGLLDERVLGALIAGAFAAAGIGEWLQWPRTRERQELHVTSGSIGGGATGIASTLTGTSGPMAAIPILGLLGIDGQRRVRIAQVAQIPIGIAALLTYATLANVPWILAAQNAAVLGAGSLAGILMARRIPAGRLRRVTSILMLLAATYMATTVL